MIRPGADGVLPITVGRALPPHSSTMVYFDEIAELDEETRDALFGKAGGSAPLGMIQTGKARYDLVSPEG